MRETGDMETVWAVINQLRETQHSLDKRLIQIESEVKTIRETHLTNLREQLASTENRLSASLQEVSINQKEMRREIKQWFIEATTKLSADVTLLIEDRHKANGAKGAIRMFHVILSGILGMAVSAIAIVTFFGG